MNKERLLKLAEHLRKPETADHFDMSGFVFNNEPISFSFEEEYDNLLNLNTKCGTVGCIAGHTVHLFFNELDEKIRNNPKYLSDNGFRIAEELLDLDFDQSENLFFTWNDDGERRDNIAAAKRIEKLVETGEI